MLINCTAYQHGRKLADIPVEAIRDTLQQPDTFVWVALKDPSANELAVMKDEFDLHELAIEDANHRHQRPKVEEYEDELFAVMHLVEEREGKLQVGEVHVFVGANYILSVRNNHERDFLGVRARCEREPKMLAKGPGYVLYALMDAVVDGYFPLIEKLETEVEALEERIFTRGAARSNIRRLYRLKRKVTLLRHAVLPLMEAAGKLHSGRVPEVCAKSRHYFRDVYDHLARINASLDGIRDTIGTAIQVNLSMVTIDQTEISKRLAAWAGIFAVATAFAGIWGMNFNHMPELTWEYGYLFGLGVIASAASFLWWRFRKAGWL
ncbi:MULTISPECIES: magnesium/cobalt transporter CorA [unclassified Thauera]|uniref:magnesium/cobalt transporter CorA n=1 Tax=unclassified Thauera TaxID=2609274 RepID=UPI0002CE099A|nr:MULTISPECIES: magnesium/cobalt transporter CorA [unclassified Thauera]ENO82187.1 magnesium and cobalt transport protein CorA [Thauera sp. 27]ENO92524.1 magnesium and cobalt transport protein CorA [Thauera sp. 28]WBL62617.1 magnesium/cobalt transporter CorA [Thauera sp. WB-2]HAG76794.1 magnesium and cobalt transport protein CorA [Thauera sp.]HNR59759.1 magnesium/cobalt transporter CorA [Thauera sp.]